jgi:acetylglutamate kinase
MRGAAVTPDSLMDPEGRMKHGSRLAVLKLGGELLEPDGVFDQIVESIVGLAAARPLVIVHGGGGEIDAELQRREVPRRAVDGLRITDAATLGAVVAVLAGTVNTRLVAALVSRDVRAVGLTGVDAQIGLSIQAPRHRAVSGELVDLGLVGVPLEGRRPELLSLLTQLGYVPVIATLGVDASGRVLNVNADTLAASLAGGCGAERLIIAGGTAGVLDAEGQTIETLDVERIDALVDAGTVSVGMIAKLLACRAAIRDGVKQIAIVNGRDGGDLETARGTRIVATEDARTVGS